MKRGSLLTFLGVAVIVWSWFGLPPLSSPEVTQGTDYSGTSALSFLIIFFGIVMIAWGLSLAVAARIK